jgi:hypothetical protein
MNMDAVGIEKGIILTMKSAEECFYRFSLFRESPRAFWSRAIAVGSLPTDNPWRFDGEVLFHAHGVTVPDCASPLDSGIDSHAGHRLA